MIVGGGWMWRHELVSGGGAREELRMNLWTSKPCLGFRDIDLDAVCPLCGWVLSERSCPFGSHEASASFLPLAVLKVQRALSHYTATPPGWPLWQRWWPLPLLGIQNDMNKESKFYILLSATCSSVARRFYMLDSQVLVSVFKGVLFVVFTPLVPSGIRLW